MTDETPVPGMLPPGFEFRMILGTGSSGWVALAKHTALDRDVAVKTVLIGDKASPAVHRLEREARVLAGMDHPGIVRVHQLIPAQSAVFLVMEYVPGRSLEAAMSDIDFSTARRTSVLRNIASALEAVHGLGIAHRDIKPGNVVVHPERGAVLLDFGLARLPPARSAFRSALGVPTGTPLYMAPEQLSEPDAATPAIDAYAFGILTYQLLLGRYPYPVSNLADVVRAHLFGRPDDPREYCPLLPAKVAYSMLRTMDRNPARRPTPSELMHSVGRVPIPCWPATRRSPSPETLAAPSSGPGPGDSPDPAAPGDRAPRWSMTLAHPAEARSALALTSDSVAEARLGPPTVAAQLTSVPVPQAVADAAAEDTKSEKWVTPSIYRPSRRPSPPRAGRRKRLMAIATTSAAGLLIGIFTVVVWLVSHR